MNLEITRASDLFSSESKEENIHSPETSNFKVSTFKTKEHLMDVGSTEAQIRILSERVDTITFHLKIHKKDYASQRGLKLILGKRKRLLRYLQKNTKDINKYP